MGHLKRRTRGNDADLFQDEVAATERAQELGLSGFHAVEQEDTTKFRPGSDPATYQAAVAPPLKRRGRPQPTANAASPVDDG